MSERPRIGHYGGGTTHRPDEAKVAWLRWRNGVEVQVLPTYGADGAHSQEAVDLAAREVAVACAENARYWGVVLERDDEIARLRAEVSRLREQIPPPSPIRVFAPGCVRMDSRGVWLLNSREQGWAAFGFLSRDWDDLFRRWNVRITEHGEDECGAYWIAVPCDHEAPATPAAPWGKR